MHQHSQSCITNHKGESAYPIGWLNKTDKVGKLYTIPSHYIYTMHKQILFEVRLKYKYASMCGKIHIIPANTATIKDILSVMSICINGNNVMVTHTKEQQFQ